MTAPTWPSGERAARHARAMAATDHCPTDDEHDDLTDAGRREVAG